MNTAGAGLQQSCALGRKEWFTQRHEGTKGPTLNGARSAFHPPV
jgi:hypothetical protein